MNTPAHLIFGTAIFGRPGAGRITGAALAGAMLPDLSLYLMTAVSIWGLGIPAERVFRELYYSDAWQAVFAVDNSLILWGALLALAAAVGRPALKAFAGAGVLHLALDLPLHTHDARRHFWPLSDWRFESPVSYWDNSAHAGVVEPTILFAVIALTVSIWRRFGSWWVRGLSGLLLAMEAASSGLWRLLL